MILTQPVSPADFRLVIIEIEIEIEKRRRDPIHLDLLTGNQLLGRGRRETVMELVEVVGQPTAQCFGQLRFPSGVMGIADGPECPSQLVDQHGPGHRRFLSAATGPRSPPLPEFTYRFSVSERDHLAGSAPIGPMRLPPPPSARGCPVRSVSTRRQIGRRSSRQPPATRRGPTPEFPSTSRGTVRWPPPLAANRPGCQRWFLCLGRPSWHSPIRQPLRRSAAESSQNWRRFGKVRSFASFPPPNQIGVAPSLGPYGDRIADHRLLSPGLETGSEEHSAPPQSPDELRFVSGGNRRLPHHAGEGKVRGGSARCSRAVRSSSALLSPGIPLPARPSTTVRP